MAAVAAAVGPVAVARGVLLAPASLLIEDKVEGAARATEHRMGLLQHNPECTVTYGTLYLHCPFLYLHFLVFHTGN